MNTENQRALLVFFTLSLVLHISFIAVYSASQSLFFMLLATWSPNISAIIVLAFVLREEHGVRRLFGVWTKWRVSLWWYLAAASPIILVNAFSVIYLFFGGSSPGPEGYYSLPTLIGLAITVIFTGATGEELGWRGFALPRLQRRFNALTSSILIGCWWGVWHVPGWIMLNEVPSLTYVGSFMLTLITQSVFLTWLVNNTDGSVLMSTLNHYLVNVSSGLIVTVYGLITWDVLSTLESLSYSLIAIVLLFRYGKRRLMLT